MGSGQWTPGCGRVPHSQRCLHEEFARRAARGSAGEPLNTFQTRSTTGRTEGREWAEWAPCRSFEAIFFVVEGIPFVVKKNIGTLLSMPNSVVER